MSKRLPAAFYRQEATLLAPLLLGKILCRRLPNGTVLRCPITETECYYGEEDTACHAHKGRTKRTEIMYRPGGAAYVYLCYGMHAMLNVVTGREEHPQAVLIRGVEGIQGPGRVTKQMQITCALNGEDLVTSQTLWIEEGDLVLPAYTVAKRVGIGYASPADQEKPWRFLVKQDNFSIKPKKKVE